MIVIECYGLPGTGKTFLSQCIQPHLERTGLRCDVRGITLGKARAAKRIAAKIELICRCLWTNWAPTYAVFALVIACRPGGLRAYIKLLFNWLHVCALIRTAPSHTNSVLLDQGIGQALWSTLYYSDGKPDEQSMAQAVVELMQRLSISSILLFHVNADKECIRRRIETRHGSKSPLDRNFEDAWHIAECVTLQARRILNEVSRSTAMLKVVGLENNNDGRPSSNFSETISFHVQSLIPTT